MKRILFFSCEPGGAETLSPVVELLQRKTTYEITVAGYGHGLARFSRNGIRCIEVEPIRRDDFSLMMRYRPDFILSSATSLPSKDMSEKLLWRNARTQGIPSMAFLDQWQNYALRFSGVADDERMAYLPDYINCINDIARGEMVGEGFRESLLLEFGHPYLSGLRRKLPGIDRQKIKQTLGIPVDAKVVLFVSEALFEHYGKGRGYDQYEVLDFLLGNLSGHAEGVATVIKLHPKDAREKFDDVIGKFPSLGPRIIEDQLSSLECLALADVVYGMSSIMLIEAYILGKKVASLQPNLKGGDLMVLSRHGIIQKVNSASGFDVLNPAPAIQRDFAYEFDEEKFLRFLKRTVG